MRVIKQLVVLGLAINAGFACPRRIPLPARLALSGIEELRARMAAAASPVESFVGEARLSYFGPQGRMKGSANLAVKRPASLRYELVGPHGGTIEAFATNGRELQLSIVGESRFFYGPASPHNIDKLSSFAPLSLDAAGWVALFFGEIRVPPEATVAYDDRLGKFVVIWTDRRRRIRLQVEPETSRAVRAEIQSGDRLLGKIEVSSWDERGLATSLRLQAPPQKIDMVVKLRDIEYDPESVEPDLFRLDPPRGVSPEYLGDDPGKVY